HAHLHTRRLQVSVKRVISIGVGDHHIITRSIVGIRAIGIVIGACTRSNVAGDIIGQGDYSSAFGSENVIVSLGLLGVLLKIERESELGKMRRDQAVGSVTNTGLVVRSALYKICRPGIREFPVRSSRGR